MILCILKNIYMKIIDENNMGCEILPSVRRLLSWISPFSRDAVAVPDR